MCAEIYERFTFWRGFQNTANMIKNKLERALFVSAIVDYALDGIEPDFKNLFACAGIELKDDKLMAFKMGFEGIRKDIEHSRRNAQYQDAHRKKQKEQEKSTSDDSILTVSKPSDDSNLTPSDKDIDKDKDNNNEQIEFALVSESSSKAVKTDPYPFEPFWKLYEKKVDRQKCEKIWAKLSAPDRAAIMAYVPGYVQATPDVDYRRNPARFLNERTWESDLPRHGQTGQSSSGKSFEDEIKDGN